MLPSHDFKERLCPFCNLELDVIYEYAATEYRCLDCRIPPYSKYMLTYDIFKELYTVSIVMNDNKDWYAISIRYDRNHTWLEKLEEVKDKDGDAYYLPINILTIDTALPFNLEDPIQSGNEIMNRLLTLRAFS